MNTEQLESTDTDDEEDVAASDDTVITNVDDDVEDDLIDITTEINVEELVAKLENTSEDDVRRRKHIRLRLEELREQHMKDLDSTYNFNLDDDI